MPRSGRQPEDGVGRRACAGCGKEFQPYRSHQIACSRPCRDKTREQSPRRDAQTLTCKGCGQEFTAMWSGMGRQPSCSSCTERLARGKMDRANAQRRGNPEYIARSFAQNLARRGLTVQQWEAMVKRQDNRCAICGNPPKPGTGPATRRLHVDHDHVTGRNRDLLCNTCNNGVGRFKDDPALLRAAADYIDRHRREGEN